MKKILALLLVLSLFCCSAALADMDLSGYSITDAKVTASHYEDITAPCSGTLLSFDVESGDRVKAGQVLFSMKTTEVCAQEDGTVSEMFLNAGDDASAVMNRYGCVGAMDADFGQRMQCTTSGAYNEDENKILHVGELLYFKSGKEGKTEGSGRVVSVKGSSYTVEILTGSFSLNERMSLYRGKDRVSKECVGRGTVIQRDPVMFSGSGTVADVYVKGGQHVCKGDPLFSLMNVDAPYGASPDVKTSQNGIVGNVSVSPCQQVWKGQLLCRVWMTDEMEITADVDEVNLHNLKVGSRAYVTLDTNKGTALEAVITEISSLGVSRQNASYYNVHARLTGDTELMLGQSASLYLPEV